MQNNRCDEHFWYQHDDKIKDKCIDIDTLFWIVVSLNSSIV